MKELAERFSRARLASGLSRATVYRDGILLGRFLEWLAARKIRDLANVSPKTVREYQRSLAAYRYRKSFAPDERPRPLTPKSRHDLVAIVRRFFRWLVAEGRLVADPTVGLHLAHPKRRLPERVLSELEVSSLLAAPDPASPTGSRDRAILELLYSTGLRRAEVASLELGDLDLTAGTVLARHGKGDRSRLVPLGSQAAEALLAYIRSARREVTKQGTTAVVFLGAPRTPRAGRPLTGGSIGLIVSRAAEAAGLARHRGTPHALRHSMATHLLRAGASIRHVQEMLGHADVTTTELYTHVAVADLLRVHARTHPRGKKPPRRR